MIYFTSDWHFGHDREFLWGGPRGFRSVEENNEELLKRHNSVVTEDDDVYVLGDLMLGNLEDGYSFIPQMKGKLHIITGNHDTLKKIEYYLTLSNVVELSEAKTIKIGKQHYFLCHYPSFTANYDDKPYHNHLINLYGHTHQKTNFFNDNPFMYHVGVDSHNGYPVSIDQVVKDIHEKVQEQYQLKIKQKELDDYYTEGLNYFDKHPAAGLEIID